MQYAYLTYLFSSLFYKSKEFLCKFTSLDQVNTICKLTLPLMLHKITETKADIAFNYYFECSYDGDR